MKSNDLLRQVQINAPAVGADFQPQNQDPTRAPNSLPGANALLTDLLRPYQGYGGIARRALRALEVPSRPSTCVTSGDEPRERLEFAPTLE